MKIWSIPSKNSLPKETHFKDFVDLETLKNTVFEVKLSGSDLIAKNPPSFPRGKGSVYLGIPDVILNMIYLQYK